MKESVLLFPDGSSADGLRGFYRGRSVFLVCGGPSLAETDLSLLYQRGLVVAAVNNVAATHVRPHLWICCDPQANFSETIWRDPAIIKLAKFKYIDKSDRQSKQAVRTWSRETMSYVPGELRTYDCPTVVGYRHTKGFDRNRFLDGLPSWGAAAIEQDPERRGKWLSVMLVAPWLLYYLGFRTIYLVGADFKMRAERPYAFDQAYSEETVSRNNSLFKWLRNRFRELAPHFRERGLRVVNCNPKSKLDAFEMLDFETAVAEAISGFPMSGRVAGHYKTQ